MSHKEAGEQFLTANKAQPNVTTSASGAAHPYEEPVVYALPVLSEAEL